jgi:hypothetical protein
LTGVSAVRARWRMLALGCIIVSFCVEHSEVTNGIPHAILTKIGVALLAESVAIIYRAKYVNFSDASSYNFVDLTVRD